MRVLSKRVAQVVNISKGRGEITEALRLVKMWPGLNNLNLSGVKLNELFGNSAAGEFRTDDPDSAFINMSDIDLGPVSQGPPGTDVKAIINYISLGSTIVHELTHKKRNDTGYLGEGFLRSQEENIAETEQEKFVQWAIKEYEKHGLKLILKK